MKKESQVDFYVCKLKNIAQVNINKKNYETSMAAVSACADILYRCNQYYMDDDLENFVDDISNSIYVLNDYHSENNTVLFYDGFGLDLRGWSISFVRNLTLCGYQLVYVTKKEARGKIPHIQQELKANMAEYINTNNYKTHIEELNKVFIKYKPKTAFFYTVPNDVAGAAVFKAYERKVNRIQIDLTDHAFWLGAKAVDLFFESRDIGARIAVHERDVDAKNIIRLDCAPYINNDICSTKLPFDIEKERYVFSGGSLYKTLGDDQLLYYKALREMLNYDKNIKFLYAGTGDSSQMKILMYEFPERVFLIDERSDFFRLIENAEFYLNTYPMFGGLMMRYAALAKKLPLTLKHDDDADGVLFNQKKLGIEFEKYEEFVLEIKKVISDTEYRKKKELEIYDSVINDETFQRNLRLLIESGTTEFEYEELPPINTERFRKEYLERFDEWEDMKCVIAKKINKSLFKYFPLIFFRKVYKYIRR
jgi:hypothetical protein